MRRASSAVRSTDGGRMRGWRVSGSGTPVPRGAVVSEADAFSPRTSYNGRPTRLDSDHQTATIPGNAGVEPPRGIEPRTHALRMPRTPARLCSPSPPRHSSTAISALPAHRALQAPVVQSTNQSTPARHQRPARPRGSHFDTVARILALGAPAVPRTDTDRRMHTRCFRAPADVALSLCASASSGGRVPDGWP